MAMAITLREYLDRNGIEYEIMPHETAYDSMEIAQAAHISGNDLAKSVILEDDKSFLMAILPSTHHVDIRKLRSLLGRNLRLTSEQKIGRIFNDCDLGAIPPMGDAYHLDMVVDKSLHGHMDIFFEAGDHHDLVHVQGRDFEQLLRNAKQGDFSHRMM